QHLPYYVTVTLFCLVHESESTALEQFEGGPCAVIAPVQAFLLKRLFTSEKSTWRDCPEVEQKNLLCHTLCDILEMACSDNSESYSLATWIRGKTTEETAGISESPAESSRQEEQPCKIFFCRLEFFLCLLYSNVLISSVVTEHLL
uniref:Ubiquitin carboxyl-terminal hydrolase MINDY n=1 Tax=Pavo cristatus TaxID=9049 RepID=A0A8C9G160_PAVCR